MMSASANWPNAVTPLTSGASSAMRRCWCIDVVRSALRAAAERVAANTAKRVDTLTASVLVGDTQPATTTSASPRALRRSPLRTASRSSDDGSEASDMATRAFASTGDVNARAGSDASMSSRRSADDSSGGAGNSSSTGTGKLRSGLSASPKAATRRRPSGSPSGARSRKASTLTAVVARHAAAAAAAGGASSAGGGGETSSGGSEASATTPQRSPVLVRADARAMRAASSSDDESRAPANAVTQAANASALTVDALVSAAGEARLSGVHMSSLPVRLADVAPLVFALDASHNELRYVTLEPGHDTCVRLCVCVRDRGDVRSADTTESTSGGSPRSLHSRGTLNARTPAPSSVLAHLTALRRLNLSHNHVSARVLLATCCCVDARAWRSCVNCHQRCSSRYRCSRSSICRITSSRRCPAASAISARYGDSTSRTTASPHCPRNLYGTLLSCDDERLMCMQVNCDALALLDISHNRLAALPAFMADLEMLRLLRCAGNPLDNELLDLVR
jgi:hypothetical protein